MMFPTLQNEWDDDGDGYVECGIDVENWRGDENILGGNDCDDTRDFMYPTLEKFAMDSMTIAI